MRRSLQIFLRANILWWVLVVCTSGALFTGMLLSVGMDQAQIGWIMSVSMFTLPVQVVGAIIQQRYFNRKRFWTWMLSSYLFMFAVLAGLVCAWPILPAGRGYMMFIVVLVLANVGFQLHRPVFLAWQTNIVPERESSAFWNRMTSQGMVMGVVVGFLMGWVADRLGRDNRLTYVFLLSIGLVFAAWSLWMSTRVPDTDPAPQRDDTGVLRNILLVVRNSNFQRLSVVFSLHSVATWLCAAFVFVHLQRTMGFSMFQMQVLGGISCLVSFAAGRLFTIVGKYYGRKPVLLICTLLKSVEFVLWGLMRPGDHALDIFVRRAATALLGEWASLPPGFVSVVPVFLLAGFVNVGIISMQLAFLRNVGTGKNQALAISLFLALSGVVGGIVAGLSGGLLNLLATPGFGPDSWRSLASGFGLVPFNVLPMSGAVVFLICAFFIRYLREDGAAPTLHVVRMLLSNNPVRGVYHAQTLSNALTEATRTQVLRQARGGLVENELVRDLYSCSSQVRDGAMRNLAEMGVEMDRAIAEELIKLLHTSELVLQVEAAKALGRSRYAPALPHLIACFDSENPSLAAAAIYASGLIEDKSVLPELRLVLQAEETTPEERALAAEAMSRMCNHSDARLIFSAFVNNTYPVLVTQCLVSICRCMEDGPHVYRFFEEEARKPGVNASVFLDSISQCWREVDAEWLGERLDAGAFHEVATAVIAPAVACFRSCSCPVGVAPEDFLKQLFQENEGFVDEQLEGSDYAATSLWLQLRLWSYLAYSTGDEDRYVLLTVLFLSDRLIKYTGPLVSGKPAARGSTKK